MASPLPTVPIGIKITNSLAPAVVVELFQDVCCPYSKKCSTPFSNRSFPYSRKKL